jgi:hypothetical protein
MPIELNNLSFYTKYISWHTAIKSGFMAQRVLTTIFAFSKMRLGKACLAKKV